VTPLSGIDALFLYLETPETPMHVGSAHLYARPAGSSGDFLDRVRRHIATRLDLAPAFRRRLAPLPFDIASPMWVDEDDVDLEYHVQRVRLRRPGNREQFEDCIARLHAQLMDRRRPLWRLYLIEGLASGQFGWYSKAHHAVVDGLAGLQFARSFLDLEPMPRRVARASRRHEARPDLAGLVAATLRNAAGQSAMLARRLPEVARVLGLLGRAPPAEESLRKNLLKMAGFGPRTPINVPITSARSFATVSLPLDEVKAVAARRDVKVNDVVLALVAAALRRYLAHHGGVPKRPLLAAMPVSLREAGNVEYTTQATMVLASLATHIADPLKRLAAISESTAAAKAVTSHARAVIPRDLPPIGLPWLLGAATRIYGSAQRLEPFPPLANVVVSNIPGPQAPLYLAGARMLTYWPVSIVGHGLGLNVTLQGYCGSLDFGLIAARNAVPNVRAIAAGIAAAHEELKALVLARRPGAPASGKKREAARVATGGRSARAAQGRQGEREAVGGS
jgi:WS/DGAT/MGAT family acyltransferase